jgi:hypothetical protein
MQRKSNFLFQVLADPRSKSVIIYSDHLTERMQWLIDITCLVIGQTVQNKAKQLISSLAVRIDLDLLMERYTNKTMLQ